MTKLECNVTNCLHNADNCCCKQAIMVDGQSRPAAEASTKTKVVSLKMSLRHQKAAWRFPARQCSAFTMKITAAQPSISALRETAQAGRSRHSVLHSRRIKILF